MFYGKTSTKEGLAGAPTQDKEGTQEGGPYLVPYSKQGGVPGTKAELEKGVGVQYVVLPAVPSCITRGISLRA